MLLHVMNLDTNNTQTLVGSELDNNCYLRRFQTCNQLAFLHSFFFMKGMHFLDSYQWWNEKKRSSCHEGLDIATFLDYSATRQLYPAKSLIPVLLPGIAVHQHSDFLGHTLYVRHEQVKQQSKILHSLYAHIDIAEDLGETISLETVIGSLSNVASPKTIAPHLHLSIAWIEENLNLENVSWKDFSNQPKIQLVDPINFITLNPAEIQGCI